MPISVNVCASREKVATSGNPATAAAASRGGSGTRRSSGMLNSIHHTPTLANDSFVAVTPGGKPNHAGCRIHARFTTAAPPPR